MNEQEIKKRIDEIDDQVQELHNERWELEHELMRVQQEKLQVLVGVCITHEKKMYKVIRVPQEDMMSAHFSFNPYQIPVVVLDGYEIFEDTIFSRAVNFDDPLEQLYKEYRTCSKQDFEYMLNNIITKIKEA